MDLIGVDIADGIMANETESVRKYVHTYLSRRDPNLIYKTRFGV